MGRRLCLAAIVSLAWACGGDDGDGEATGDRSDATRAQDDSPDGGGPVLDYTESEVIGEAPPFLAERDDGWLSLVQAQWELPAGTEGYRCVRVTVPHDVSIGAIRPLAPLGTHHTVLSANVEPDAPDGITECTAFVNGEKQLGASGVGTEHITLPDGVAMTLREGEQLLLNLHLFNSGDEPLTGTSGVLVQTLDDAEVVHRASSVLAGPVELDIPAGRVTQTGGCTFTEPTTVIGHMPHMHQLGVHMKITLRNDAGDTLIHDAPYDFDDQKILMIEPVEVAAGDFMQVDCTYDNDTDATVNWGDSSLQEMCFAILYRYPEEQNFFCVE